VRDISPQWTKLATFFADKKVKEKDKGVWQPFLCGSWVHSYG
jgi:hypothetical protein